MSASSFRRLGLAFCGLWLACLLLEWLTDHTAGVVLELVDAPPQNGRVELFHDDETEVHA